MLSEIYQCDTDGVVPKFQTAERGKGVEKQQDKEAVERRVDAQLYSDRGAPDSMNFGNMTWVKLLRSDSMR